MEPVEPAGPGVIYDVVVSLGTDHHRFDRLVDWLDAWLTTRPDVRCLLQHGFSRPSTLATSVPRLPRTELLEHYRRASAVVVQGGPGSILDARGLGLMPFAVPRLARLGEHVDNHQAVFTAYMVEQGEALRPDTGDALAGLLDAALARPAEFRTEPRRASPELATRELDSALARAHRAARRPGDVTRRLLWTARESLPQSHRSSAGAA